MLALLSILALATAPAALAAPWDFVFRESGTSAFAQTEFNCTDNGDGTETCSSSGVNVFAGRSKQIGTSTIHEERVCYSAFSDDVRLGDRRVH